MLIAREHAEREDIRGGSALGQGRVQGVLPSHFFPLRVFVLP